ncbi:MAG: DUF4924 family protein [Marinifilaceae bacterium]
MLIAKEKKKSNIAEYVIYMWQVEDLLRAFNFDSDKLYMAIFGTQNYSSEKVEEIKYWYANLSEMMKIENVLEKGHVQVIKNIVNDMTDLHFNLLHEVKDPRYAQIIQMSADNLIEFRAGNSVSNDISDVELAIMALYGVLMLKLQKKIVSKETTTAINGFSKMLAYLSKKYKEMEDKDLDKE